jgi:hypothetical protein
MTESKKPNPIEEAIGERAKDPDGAKKFRAEYEIDPVGNLPEQTHPKSSLKKTKEQIHREAHDLQIPADLEALNQQTEERLLNHPTTDPQNSLTKEQFKELVNPTPQQFPKKVTHVSKPDPQPVTETSSPESQPPQGNKPDICSFCKEAQVTTVSGYVHTCEGGVFHVKPDGIFDESIDEPPNHEKHVATYNKTADKLGIPKIETSTMAESLGQKMNDAVKVPAEERELTALKEYILDNGFNAAGVAMHIVMLCSQPMVTPSTTTWDFKDRANVPELVLNVLKAPGYIEGIWPSLSVVMGSNKGNAAWSAGIATTIAFFDVIRLLPVMKE